MATRRAPGKKAGRTRTAPKRGRGSGKGAPPQRAADPTFLCVFGHTNMDYIIDLPNLPTKDASVQVIESRQHFGGVAGNIARLAATLGVPCSLVSYVGHNFPEDYQRALAGAGVDLRAFTRMSGYFTPTCWIMTDRDLNQFSIINPGPMKDLATFELRTDAIDRGRIVHLTTGNPAHYIKAGEYAKRHGKTVGIDPAQEIHYSYDGPTLDRLLKTATFLFSNRSESEIMMRLLGLSDLNGLASRVPILVTTLGKDGSEIRCQGATIRVPAVPPEKVVDPTGAGDGYRAGFYAALHRGYDLYEAGLFGAAVSSFVIEAVGPQGKVPSWPEAERRLRDLRLAPKSPARHRSPRWDGDPAAGKRTSER